MLRQHRTEVSVLEGEVVDELSTLIADYWMTVPNTKRVLLVSFSTVRRWPATLVRGSSRRPDQRTTRYEC